MKKIINPKNLNKPTQNLVKNIAVIFVIIVIISGLFALYNPGSSQQNSKDNINLSQLVELINQEKVEKIIIKNDLLEIELQDQTKLKTMKEAETSLTETLKNYNISPEKLALIQIEIQQPTGWQTAIGIIAPIIFPLGLIIAFFWLMSGQAKKLNFQSMGFGKSLVRKITPEKDNNGKKKGTTFKDVAGLEQPKEELYEVVEFLKSPKKFTKLGAKIPKGALLIGPPGCGKTLLARAVANEAEVPFFNISGSEFVEMFVGVGASRVRDTFQTAKKNAPAILFVDELDAIGRQRSMGMGAAHDEREQTLNQILVEMDGFEPDTGVIVLAATNRPDVLDAALLRPGRFDRRVTLDLPDINDRQAILQIHAKGKPLNKKVSFRNIAERTPGFSGADLANLVNEAAILAARNNRCEIIMQDLRQAIEKVLLGPERKSHLLSKHEKKITAYHEAGHALLATKCKHTDPVQKVSIIARGHAAGYTLKVPIKEKTLRSKLEFLDELSVLLAGYEAEKMIFQDITTGASNDLKEATNLAYKLVTEYGMSDKIGPIQYKNESTWNFLGQEMPNNKQFSDKTASSVDNEVRRIILSAQKNTLAVLTKYKNKLELIAKELVEKETIEKERFKELIK